MNPVDSAGVAILPRPNTLFTGKNSRYVGDAKVILRDSFLEEPKRLLFGAYQDLPHSSLGRWLTRIDKA
jgi:hypothetical protein